MKQHPSGARSRTGRKEDTPEERLQKLEAVLTREPMISARLSPFSHH